MFTKLKSNDKLRYRYYIETRFDYYIESTVYNYPKFRKRKKITKEISLKLKFNNEI